MYTRIYVCVYIYTQVLPGRPVPTSRIWKPMYRFRDYCRRRREFSLFALVDAVQRNLISLTRWCEVSRSLDSLAWIYESERWGYTRVLMRDCRDERGEFLFRGCWCALYTRCWWWCGLLEFPGRIWLIVFFLSCYFWKVCSTLVSRDEIHQGMIRFLGKVIILKREPSETFFFFKIWNRIELGVFISLKYLNSDVKSLSRIW